jgi:SOS response regulatory protein OraA/RecX
LDQSIDINHIEHKKDNKRKRVNMALNQVLVDYIQNQVRKGFSIGSIKEFLLSQGYDASEVNEAIFAITKDRVESMKSYINQEVNKGESKANIRSNLVSYGYSQEEVNQAMKSIGSKMPSWAILAVLVIFVIIGGVLYVISIPSTDVANIPNAPSALSVPSTSSNLPVAASPDIQTPSVTEDDTAKARQDAEFIQAERKYDVINASRDEKIMKAVQMCENTANEIYKDACFDQLSKATRDQSLCSRITDSVQKDNCYKRTAIYTRNKEVCNEIADPQIRGECQIYEYV